MFVHSGIACSARWSTWILALGVSGGPNVRNRHEGCDTLGMSELWHVTRRKHLEVGVRDEPTHHLCDIDRADLIVITPDQ